ncbi:hypothetical protein FH972_023635 [Carpinus fangiana]|nr:hypothetical protein FH972_023635 [Carpinus fangiana]KAB8349615.1 hypothetical protein FH972_023635 [Carpinus fangiana]KAB8349616.1 hypothetical protein FH972_023635 [Carpinus fangiana]
MHEDLLAPGLYSADAPPRLTGTPSYGAGTPEPHSHLMDEMSSEKPSGSTVKAFNAQVLLSIAAYGILAFHTIAFEQLMPVLLSMDASEDPVELPFKFTGGYGLPSSTIGFILSCQGIYQMAAQLLLFPYVVGKLGNLWTFRLTALSYPLLYFTVPYLALLPHTVRMPALALVLVWKVTFQALAYPANQLFLTNAVPSTMVLGAVNGVAASAASLARAFGPTLSGYIESVGLDMGYMGLPWWMGAAVAMLGGVECLFMRERRLAVEVSLPRSSTDTNASDTTLVDEQFQQQTVLPKSS